MGHAGTALELGVPISLLLSPGGWSLVAGMILMLLLHGFITSNVLRNSFSVISGSSFFSAATDRATVFGSCPPFYKSWKAFAHTFPVDAFNPSPNRAL